jgi:hypothetical protein
LALLWAFLRMGSSLVAFMTSPLTFSFPLMKSFCALALPATRSEKVASVRLRVTRRGGRRHVLVFRCGYSQSFFRFSVGFCFFVPSLRHMPYDDQRRIFSRIGVLLKRQRKKNEDSPPAFLPAGAAPLPRVPVSFRSMYQACSLPALFLRLKAKMAPPFLMASLRSASLWRADAMASKAAEEGNASVSVACQLRSLLVTCHRWIYSGLLGGRRMRCRCART